MASFVERMVGAAKLNVNTYEEVEADKGATGQALAVVVLSSIAGGIGAASFKGGVAWSVLGVIVYTVIDLIGWVIWAFLSFIIGTKLLPEPETKSDMGELLRTTGFSTSPGIFKILGVIPYLGALIRLAVWIWMLVTFVVAIRQALDYKSTGRAIGVALIGGVVYAIFIFVLGAFLFTLIAVAVGVAGAAAGGAH